MAGIYFHIPFCKQACHYCDFHFSTSKQGMAELLQAMLREMELRKDYLQQQPINTLYFGGGTPSLVPISDIQYLIDKAHQLGVVNADAELTLEANPDDLTHKKLQELRKAGINRLSIGVQSFDDSVLQWMNRSHKSSQSEYAVKASQDAGFENITIDLIYAVPVQSDEVWKENLRRAFELNVPHISAYNLTIENKTYLGHLHKKGKLQEVDQEEAATQFLMMLEMMMANGFEQYEVSNFCKEKKYSRHNTAYWQGTHYLGIGPSAHSYNTETRQWNVANNAQYTRSILKNEVPAEIEVLTREMKINEALMTGLRTMWGVDVQHLKQLHQFDVMLENKEQIEMLIEQADMKLENGNLVLTTSGLLKADAIAASMFVSA
ncbi:MAG: radical SAM family heme chaperone HemW [Flavobacteriales bacterium]